MQTLQINTPGQKSEIFLVDSRKLFQQFCAPNRTIIITDQNLYRLYNTDWADYQVIVIPPGEKSKNLKRVEKIYSQLLSAGVDRDWTILGWGGGVVCDITGFVASTYLRGLDCGFVATSLLAQVDASIGGKNGVNFANAKNLIGSINQPRFVICPQDVLDTLPQKHFINGMAEIIKTAVIGDRYLSSTISEKREAILNRQPEILQEIIYRTIRYKAQIVSRDARENNERRLLNFGHTIGHAIEILTGILHGHAIAIGMYWAAAIANRLAYLSEGEVTELQQLLTAYGLPTTTRINCDELYDIIYKDKKRQGNTIRFVILKSIGSAEVITLTYPQLKELLYDLRLPN